MIDKTPLSEEEFLATSIAQYELNDYPWLTVQLLRHDLEKYWVYGRRDKTAIYVLHHWDHFSHVSRNPCGHEPYGYYGGSQIGDLMVSFGYLPPDNAPITLLADGSTSMTIDPRTGGFVVLTTDFDRTIHFEKSADHAFVRLQGHASRPAPTLYQRIDRAYDWLSYMWHSRLNFPRRNGTSTSIPLRRSGITWRWRRK